MELAQKPYSQEITRTAKFEAGGSITEGLIGLGAAVLAIIGLAGGFPFFMMAIATIVVGAAFFLHGSAMSTRYSKLAALVTENKYQANQLRSGASVETIGGITGIALGILALIGLAPITLVSVAVIIFGATLIIGTGAIDRMNTLAAEIWNDSKALRLAHNASETAMGVQTLVGLGAIALGVLAIIGVAPLTLALIALLGLGAADFLSGSVVGGSLSRAFSR